MLSQAPTRYQPLKKGATGCGAVLESSRPPALRPWLRLHVWTLRNVRESGHTSISGMMAGKDCTIPKHGGKQVCLVWALKGECSSGCKRKDLHKRYNQTVNQELHTLLDACGVANIQE